jgi:signal transduction histidine kinase
LVRAALSADSTVWQDQVTRLAKEAAVRITVVDQSGRVRADSDVPAAELPQVENHASRPEIQQALRGSVGSNKRHSATIGSDLMYVAVPGGPGVVRVALSLEQVDHIVRQAQGPVALAGLVALIIGLLLAVLTSQSIARPLRELETASQAIAIGLPPQFPRSGISDIDRLARTMKDMHEQLALRFDELRKRQAETAALVDAMVEGVISCDARGHVVTANPAARRMLGYTNGAPLPDLPLLFRTKPAREIVDAILSGNPEMAREIELDERVYQINARPLEAGGAVVVLHDLTQQRHLETVRRDFVANVSHELKTPLTAISGYAETLLSDSPDPVTTRRFLETILTNARRMHRLVDDQLDLSRIESGHWTPSKEPFRIEPILRDLWNSFDDGRTVLPNFRAVVDLRAAVLTADPDAVRQILRNLFENAIRHTPPGGTVTGQAVPFEGGIRLSVIDTGTGIAGEHLHRIFERFYRVDAGRSREAGGTGLGLAIVKHLVEAQGGRVWAESELNHGTAIHCWFPLPSSSTNGAGLAS